MEGSKWYPVYTNARAEKKVFDLLQKKGIECYLPLTRQLKQWSDRKKWVEEPLIKSYIFVRINLQLQQTDVLSTKGITRFLYFSGKVASMPDKQIELLKLMLSNSEDIEVVEQYIEPGDRVLIKAGPLQGYTGEIVDYHSTKRMILRIEHTGASLLMQMPVAFMEPLSARLPPAP